MRHFLKNLISKKLKKVLPRFLRKSIYHSAHLRNSTDFSEIGKAGPVITDIFEPVKDIPGWFNVDDCGHFYLILSFQASLGIKGDLLEIGSYHGRSTAVMGKCLKPGERIVVCDAFDLDTDDEYANKPSPEILVDNIKGLNDSLEKNSVVIKKCLSKNLHLDSAEKFRFIHIDGGHSADQAYFDLELCSKHLISNGIIAMDDYHNKMWPGVTEGTNNFLKAHDDFRVLADLNRHGALGRKLYLIKDK